MAYDYYCTKCASRINEETVLFDMQELFTGDASRKFQILKFRMTEQELRAFQETGEPLPDGSYRCSLTFPQLMEYISRKHNLNIPTAVELTMEDVVAFTDVEEPGYSIQDDDEDLFGALLLMEESENPESAEPEQFWAWAIEEIKQNTTCMGIMDAERGLRDDLRLVRQLFQDGSYHFNVKLCFEDDDKGNPVLYGMNIGKPNERNTQLENRVCPICGGKIYPHAGTAEHKAVVFIGEQFSGIEDVITVLSHYALNHLQFDCGSPIWRGASNIGAVEEISLLGPTLEFQKKLACFGSGITPRKGGVKIRDDACSATFMIKTSSAGKIKKRIITLTDLPGDCLLWDGNLHRCIFCGDFEIVSACEAIVVCHDASQLQQELEHSGEEKQNQENGGYQVLRLGTSMQNTCCWADNFQTRLMRECDKKAYVPTMALISCPRERDDDERSVVRCGIISPQTEVYMFKEEAAVIAQTREYAVFVNRLMQTGGMETAFLAAMRCSAFGYRNPETDEWTMPNRYDLQLPRPWNIDKLMHWILMVTGCVPVKARYRPQLVENHFYQLNGYYMDRIQYRRENPQYNGDHPDEALARCALFSNPGEHDKTCVVKMDDAAGSYLQRMKMNLRPDSNAQ